MQATAAFRPPFIYHTRQQLRSVSCPGVVFTIRAPSYAKECEIQEARLRILSETRRFDWRTAKIPDRDWEDATEEYLRRRYTLAAIEKMLVEVRGLRIDGHEVVFGDAAPGCSSLSDFFDSAPPALIDEIGAAIKGELSQAAATFPAPHFSLARLGVSYRLLLPALAGLSILFYILAFTGGGLRTLFSHDDLMNAYRAVVATPAQLAVENVCFFLPSPSFRPLGTLYYRLLLDLFHMNPVPFRVVLLGFLLANVWLLYALTRELTRSREIGLIAASLHAFHNEFLYLYLNTGTCFDILCFFFYVSALLLYVRVRQQNRFLRPLEWAAFLALFVCSLDSKELAVTLPVIVGLYELIYHPPLRLARGEIARWIVKQGAFLWVGGIFDAAYIAGRVYDRNGLAHIGEYQPVLSLKMYFHTLAAYMNELFYSIDGSLFTVRRLILLLSVLAAIAAFSRLPLLRFALLFTLAGLAPIAFVPARGLYAAYLPLAGLALFAAGTMIKARDLLRDGIRKRLPARYRARAGSAVQWQAATFVIVLFALCTWHARNPRWTPGNWIDREDGEIRMVVEQLRAHPAVLHKQHARILYLIDPFQTQQQKQWATVWIPALMTGDLRIDVDRFAALKAKPSPDEIRERYDLVLSMDGQRLREIGPPEIPAFIGRATDAARALPACWSDLTH